MYFQIENTPERIKKARREQVVQKESPVEKCPRLVLAPFTERPQVVFDNVLIGTSCKRDLEVHNPLKQTQQITLGKSLPPGLVIQLPGEWLELEPETCYCLSMMWTPIQPTMTRETIRFTNDNRRNFDINIILKTCMNTKAKQSKGSKISPGKIKKRVTKKSPVLINKKKVEIINNTTIIQTTKIRKIRISNKENFATTNNISIGSHAVKTCPFDCSADFSFNTSEVFSGTKHYSQDTYDKDYTVNSKPCIYDNVLKPSNKQVDSPINLDRLDMIDNMTFTPLRNLPEKTAKLEKGPNIIFSLNSDSENDNSFDVRNKENEMHSIVSVISTQSNKWLTINHETQHNLQNFQTPVIQNKKHPDTSSPKEFNSPNFSINTDFSRISDLSFNPQKFSTDKKCFPKINNDTHDILDDIKISSDTYTKESPITPLEPYIQLAEQRPNYKICRQSLFKDTQTQRDTYDKFSIAENYDKHYSKSNDINHWRNYHKMDPRSPPRSITPPLQSIPEESHHISDSDKQASTFTINRTFDTNNSKLSTSNTQLWSKKAIRVEPDIWKIPVSHVKKQVKTKTSMKTKDSICGNDNNKSVEQNISLNQIGNIYSQSFTVDPFTSTTYFYDEKAVNKFEVEFKRWLNCILTPPADLESNVEQKIDVGKAWIENRNKEIPLAPTKEHVSSMYHNSQRLKSLRRAAKALLASPEISKVLEKLNAQIDKKLIAIRNDRNPHLDVGLQKIIMELLLSYNPLWLRIGLEAIYRLVIPLKSNSDIEGLTTFIIQRMFKNPYLRNKHSKSNVPNMLLPAYMEAIKKFTLKKFFTLILFLDQAKQIKLIPHDPCLFCRNAICKDSREIIIRFTRELIAGIGDITKHLRPLGYVVSHKQSYLDEYKYAVNNIALDIRDGVRLTKVMEIILIKNSLLNQLRTPAISRLQKIHNVQVALNALKEAKFVIVGDITANDIVEGHREKTLSLLWQIIHVFRAPLFEKASVIIQTWWRKKYSVIVQERKQKEEECKKVNDAASLIQCWWRRIQYNRQMQIKMQKITTATIVMQKYWRMWLCRTQFRKLKLSAIIIKQWYKSVKFAREAKITLNRLKQEREQLRRICATTIQSYVRRWLCMKQYKREIKNIIIIQKIVRRFIVRSQYLHFYKSVIYIQQKFRSTQIMKLERQKFIEQRRSSIVIQSFYRMVIQYRQYKKLKHAALNVEKYYIALVQMRKQRKEYLNFKKNVIKIQALYRGKKCREEFLKNRNFIIQLQRKIRAKQSMKVERKRYLNMKNAAIVLQRHFKSYLLAKKIKLCYQKLCESTILIQRVFRSNLLAKAQRKSYNDLRYCTIIIQKRYRNLLLMHRERAEFMKIKNSIIFIQRKYRAKLAMRNYKEKYGILRKSIIASQRRFRALLQMRKERTEYLKLKLSCIVIQNAYRAYLNGKRQRELYLTQKTAAVRIQNWFRNCIKGRQIKHEYENTKNACIFIQKVYRSFIICKRQRLEYIRVRKATIHIQQYYRCYIEMTIVRQQFIKLKAATIVIQRYYRLRLETKKAVDNYLRMKSAASYIANYYRRYKETTKIRDEYLKLKKATQFIQIKYRSILEMRIQRQYYLKFRIAVIFIQNKYRALREMRKERTNYTKLKSAVIIIQRKFRATILMKLERANYLQELKSCISIQKYYRAYTEMKNQRQAYLELRESVVKIQRRYRALLEMRKERDIYLKNRAAAIIIQRKYRGYRQTVIERKNYTEVKQACIKIQRFYRALQTGRRQRIEYNDLKHAAILIQTRYRLIKEGRRIRKEYLMLKKATVLVQKRFRANKLNRILRENEAATKIQHWYISIKKRNECRDTFLKIIHSVIIIQSSYRKFAARKRYNEMKKSVVIIQKYYRSYKLMRNERRIYLETINSIKILQSYLRMCVKRIQYLKLRNAALTIQSEFRCKKLRDLTNKRRQEAVVCIQKNIRRHIQKSRYNELRNSVIFIQKLWKGMLITRLFRCEFLQKKRKVIRFQSVIRGYLVRKKIQEQRENMKKLLEQQRLSWAASKIQALFRGHHVRLAMSYDERLLELRRRWRDGALNSNQQTLIELHEEAMVVLRNRSDIETVIRAFQNLEYISILNPMKYMDHVSSIVRCIYVYMSVTNRSISSIEVLKYATMFLINLTRCRSIGPKMYTRDLISPILKYMLRFSNSETQLFCIFATYLWLFAKYDDVREDLTDFLQLPENHKILTTIKGNINRMMRMTTNSGKNKLHLQTSRSVSKVANISICSASSVGNNMSYLQPALESDYGIINANKPRYFEDAQQAISCLFDTYKL